MNNCVVIQAIQSQRLELSWLPSGGGIGCVYLVPRMFGLRLLRLFPLGLDWCFLPVEAAVVDSFVFSHPFIWIDRLRRLADGCMRSDWIHRK